MRTQTIKLSLLIYPLIVLFFLIVPIEAVMAEPVGQFVNSGKWHDYFSPGDEVPKVLDVNDDQCDDIVTFTKGSEADVYVALSNCSNGFGVGVKWHDYFSPDDEIPDVGYFDMDDCEDIITFTRGDSADVWVALSDCSGSFGPATKWHDYFASGDEIPRIGWFDYGECSDIVTFTKGTSADVYVALSNCVDRFNGLGNKWHDYFSPGDEIPLVGNFDNDGYYGYSDIITFTRGNTADVYVALNSGNHRFDGIGMKWHDYFAPWNETPLTSRYYGFDDDSDNVTDIISFTHGTSADVYVALNAETNSSFNGFAWKWHDYFSPEGEVAMVGDFDGDKKDDIITFTKGESADVYVALNDYQD